jgi:hypothetical protein
MQNLFFKLNLLRMNPPFEERLHGIIEPEQVSVLHYQKYEISQG